jgi:hypothetical protein
MLFVFVSTLLFNFLKDSGFGVETNIFDDKVQRLDHVASGSHRHN